MGSVSSLQICPGAPSSPTRRVLLDLTIVQMAPRGVHTCGDEHFLLKNTRGIKRVSSTQKIDGGLVDCPTQLVYIWIFILCQRTNIKDIAG